MNRKVKFAIMTVVALAIILLPTIAVSAQSGALAPAKTYPKGTICGDAQIGPWSTSVFKGRSDFQGYYSLFTLNNFKLSGGNIGKVSSTSGTLTVYSDKGGKALFSASYRNMKGEYTISGAKMKLSQFTASEIVVNFNMITGHPKDQKVMPGTYFGAHVPTQTLGCMTQDTKA
jgi:hypothetical protein